MVKKDSWRYGPLLIVLGISAVVARSLLTNWQIWGHSSTIDYARLLELDHLIRQGYLYPRWCADFYYGFGSPLFNFYAPAGYWIGEIFALAGANILYAVKMVYVLGIFLAGIGMFLFAGRLWGRIGGTASAVMYVLAPYFLLDVYVRASLGEVLCFAWIPLILFFLLRGLDGSQASYVIGSFLMALLIFSHNITALLLFPALVPLILLHCRKGEPRPCLFRGLGFNALALGLSAFFWLPALFERPFVLGNEILTSGDYWYRDHFLTFRDLFERRWGFGTSRPGDSISLQLGIFHWTLPLAAGAVLFWKRALRKPVTIWLWLVFAGSIFLTLSASAFIWDRVPLLPFVQFPWRFLLFATFASSALSGAAFMFLESRRPGWQITGLTVVVLAAVLAYGGYTAPRFLVMDTTTREPRILEKHDLASALDDSSFVLFEEFLTVDAMRHIGMRATILDDFLPVWVARAPTSLPKRTYRVIRGELSVEPVWEKPQKRVYRVESTTGGTVEFPTFWFPGWKGSVDGEEIDLFPQGPMGCLNAEVPPGEHMLTVRFAHTPVRMSGEVLSIVTLVVAILILVLSRRKAGQRP